MTYRVLGPAVQGSPIKHQSGQTINLAPGAVADLQDFLAQHAMANGCTIVCPSGTTAQRTPSPVRTQLFIDTTLSAVIMYDGAAWRNVLTGAAV